MLKRVLYLLTCIGNGIIILALVGFQGFTIVNRRVVIGGWCIITQLFLTN